MFFPDILESTTAEKCHRSLTFPKSVQMLMIWAVLWLHGPGLSLMWFSDMAWAHMQVLLSAQVWSWRYQLSGMSQGQFWWCFSCLSVSTRAPIIIVLKLNSFRAPSGETTQNCVVQQHRPQFSSINGEILWPWPCLFIWICDGWTFSPDHSGFSRKPLDSLTLKGLFAVVSFNAVSSPGEIEQPAFL